MRTMGAIVVVVLAGVLGCSASANGNNCGNTVETAGAGGTGGSGGGAALVTVGTGGNFPASYHPIACAGTVTNYPPPPATPTGTHVDLALPERSLFLRFAAKVEPHPGHAKLPEAMPLLEFGAFPAVGSGLTSWAAVVHDAVKDVGKYEEQHEINLDLVPSGPGIEIKNSAYAYNVVAMPEAGVGALGGSMFSDWVCYVALAGCVDDNGATLPDGTPCGTKGTCTLGACSD